MITVEEVAELIRREARGKLPDGLALSGSTHLKDIGLSSLQVSEIVFTLEERYDVEFDEARAAEIQTLDDVVTVANEALGEPAELVANEALAEPTEPVANEAVAEPAEPVGQTAAS